MMAMMMAIMIVMMIVMMPAIVPVLATSTPRVVRKKWNKTPWVRPNAQQRPQAKAGGNDNGLMDNDLADRCDRSIAAHRERVQRVRVDTTRESHG